MPPIALAAGVVIADRYRLESQLGEGGMGVVWSATHVVTKKRVALKILKLEGTSAAQRRRFIREARAACAVRHPNVREVHDVLDPTSDAPVLVMEHLEGESLARLLGREGKLSLARAAELLLPVVSAVGAAHAAGIIHRDLKPENVFLAEGARAGPRVLDFGIAKVREPSGDASESLSTETGTLMGTPAYMSPEQVFGERDVDHRADVWALGLVLYRALSGVLPTHGENVGQVMKSIVAKPIPPIETLVSELPDDVRRLLRKMVSRERDRRPTLTQVAEVLERYTSARAPAFGPPALGREHLEPQPHEPHEPHALDSGLETGASAALTTEVPEPRAVASTGASLEGRTHETTVEGPASGAGALARSHDESASEGRPGRSRARLALALGAVATAALAAGFVARGAGGTSSAGAMASQAGALPGAGEAPAPSTLVATPTSPVPLPPSTVTSSTSTPSTSTPSISAPVTPSDAAPTSTSRAPPRHASAPASPAGSSTLAPGSASTGRATPRGSAVASTPTPPTSFLPSENFE